ncbi:MAG: Nramp family divalent metal transporter [Alphaproteobacteria bacterium]|nr:Nramp family divalent metal transporter [Alphaproteobacteria bacterium]
MFRHTRGSHSSLPEIRESIPVSGGTSWKRALSFAGPGYLVATGYMDPGNWATSIAGGSAFGYTLLSVALLSNIIAMLLQALCVRLGIGAGRDLAQACRDAFPRPIAFFLWVMAEIAICATDLAEIIGTAIALQILFGIPLGIGVIVTTLDVFLVLALQNLGFRWIEAFIISLLVVIAACFGIEIALARPDFAAVLSGFAPDLSIVRNPDMLYIALGILGATVMPHNLYLHSAIVQTRAVGTSEAERRAAIRYASWDSSVALMLALFVNAAILILAAATFHFSGHRDVADITTASTLLNPLLGSGIAALAFAVALLCSGLNSTVTATITGQVVMEGFVHIRLKPVWRRLLTRGIAILPAIAAALYYGAEGTTKLLVASQVVLSLQLPFAMVPLVWFTAQKSKMGAFTAPRWMSAAAIASSALIIGLNVKMLADFFP